MRRCYVAFLAVASLCAPARAQDMSEAKKDAVVELGNGFSECSAFYASALQCSDPEDGEVSSRLTESADSAGEAADLLLRIAGASESSIAALAKLNTEKVMSELGDTCQNEAATFGKYYENCKNMAADPKGAFDRILGDPDE